MNVSFLTVMPSPYMQDLFEAMHADGRIRPRAFYMEMAAPDTHWVQAPLPKYAEVRPGRWFSFGGGRVHVNLGMIPALRESQPDLVVVMGYSSLTTQAAMGWLRARRIPWVFWGELSGMTPRGRVGSAFRWLARRPAVQWPDGIAAIGSAALEAYGALARKDCLLSNIPYHCDLEPFLKISRAVERPNRSPRFLYCGQLIPRKGVDLLVRAFVRLAAEYNGAHLTLVGKGPMRHDLMNLIPDTLRPQVTFAGFCRPDMLPAHFADADVFVLPSRHDGWGVVVNQAIAAGLPVICSDAVGAGRDLVAPGQNGFVAPAGDENKLMNAMREFASAPEMCRSFGTRSREISLDWTPERGVDRWHAMCQAVLARTGRVSHRNSVVGGSYR